jgi:hypothetical protein
VAFGASQDTLSRVPNVGTAMPHVSPDVTLIDLAPDVKEAPATNVSRPVGVRDRPLGPRLSQSRVAGAGPPTG